MFRRNVLLVICLLVQVCFFKASINAQELSPEELVATFVSGHSFGYTAISFETNGNYKINAGDCTMEYFRSGKYKFLDNLVLFNELKSKSQQRGFDEVSLSKLSESERKEYLNEEEFEENSNTYKMTIIKWSERLYLISENELENFYNAVNLGIEPRLELGSEPFYGSFYLREGDELKDVNGKPELPGKWNEYILKTPVTAKVTKIEKGEKNENIATINKGNASGLKVGMRLIKRNQKPSLWSDARVISVEKYSAKIAISDKLKIGEVLTSKFNRSKEDEMLILIRRNANREKPTLQ